MWYHNIIVTPNVWWLIVANFNLNHQGNFKWHLNFFEMKIKLKFTFQIDIRNQIDLYFHFLFVFHLISKVISCFIDQVLFN